MKTGLHGAPEPAHLVHFYADTGDLVAQAGPYLAGALSGDGGALLMAVPGHDRLLLDALGRDGVDVRSATAEGRLVIADAAQALAACLREGRVDRRGFEAAIGAPVRQLASRCRTVCVFGEVVSLLWEAGHVMAALDLEAQGNELRRGHPFGLLCAYPSHVMDDVPTFGVLAQVCAAHDEVSGAAPVAAGAEHSARFPRSEMAAGSARRFVADTLDKWGRAGAADDAVLVVSELVTNAVRHARSDVSVGVSRRDSAVKIAVGDVSPEAAGPVGHGSTSAGGRGLALVDAVSSEWGQEQLAAGKVVWAVVGTDR